MNAGTNLTALGLLTYVAFSGRGSAATVSTLRMDGAPGFAQRLKDAGLDVAGVDLVNGTVDVVTHEEGASRLLHLDGYAVIRERAVDQAKGPDAGYQTPAEVEAALKALHERYPSLTKVETLGKSREGRDIWALKIAVHPDAHDPAKPVALFNGMHHAREVMTTEVVLDTAEHLLAGYGQDAKATHWVDANEIWLVPMLNVDGSNKVWNGSALWRKNTGGIMGVDINRNYPFKWGVCNGSSPFFFMEDYRGGSAGSELETKALMGLVSRVQPVVDISYHSYSELVIYPYGCDGTHTETKATVEGIGRKMAALLPRDDDKGTYEPGTSWEVIYDTDGTDIDWMYNEHNVLAYTIEMNASDEGFQPEFAKWRQPTVEKMRAAWGYLLDQLEASGVRGVITAPSVVGATVAVQALGSESAAVEVAPVRADGSFHMMLEPGAYKLTIAVGGRSVERDVTVGAERVDLDVSM